MEINNPVNVNPQRLSQSVDDKHKLTPPSSSSSAVLERLAAKPNVTDTHNSITPPNKSTFSKLAKAVKLPSIKALKGIRQNVTRNLGKLATSMLPKPTTPRPTDAPARDSEPTHLKSALKQVDPDSTAATNLENGKNKSVVKRVSFNLHLDKSTYAMMSQETLTFRDNIPPIESTKLPEDLFNRFLDDSVNLKNENQKKAATRTGQFEAAQPNKISSPSNSHQQSPQQDFNRLPSEAAPAAVESQTAEPQPRKFSRLLKAAKLRSWNPFKQSGRKKNENLKEVFNNFQIKNSKEKNEIWLGQLSRYGLDAVNNQHAVSVVIESLRNDIEAFQSQYNKNLFANVMDSLAGLETSLKENVGQTGIAAFNMKLLHAFGLQDAKEQKDLDIAFDKVRTFLEKEGTPGKSYLDQLNDMSKRMTMSELISRPSDDGAQIVANFVKKLCAEKQIFFSETLLDQFSLNQMNKNRIDKRETGLANTIVVTENRQLIKLHNSVLSEDLAAEHDAVQTFKETLKKDSVLDLKVTAHSTNPNMEKVLLGTGTTGRVRIGENIAKGELCAVKKVLDRESAVNELAQAKKLREKLDDLTLQHDFLFSEDALATKIGHNDEVKTYIIMPLADKGDGWDDLERLSKLGSDDADFVDEHFKVVHRWLELGATLQKNSMVHTDFKPLNIIGGRIADVDGIMYSPGKFKIGTADYMPPEASGRKVEEKAFNAFTSFSLGIMTMESVTGERGPGLKRNRVAYVHGYQNSNPEEAPRGRKPYTPYENGVIQIAKQLAAHNPDKRITAEEAITRLEDLKKAIAPDTGG